MIYIDFIYLIVVIQTDVCAWTTDFGSKYTGVYKYAMRFVTISCHGSLVQVK